ncbi:MAG: flagellar protein export ATPase FliI [bacterium]
MHTANRFNKYFDHLEKASLFKILGQVQKSIGSVIETNGPATSIGELCQIQLKNGVTIPAEVVGFRDNKVMLMPLDDTVGIEPGSYVAVNDTPFTIGVGRGLLGRVLDGSGHPIDDKGPLACEKQQPVQNSPPNPLKRQRITEPLATGIRTIDGLLTCGKGQRVGIFAGSGVGKSILLGMIARNTAADVNVIALIGERGREVRDFIERDLGVEGLKRSVVITVTSEKTAFLRVKGALIATAIAEYFSGLGLHVMLMMDSLTRVAMAQREVGLSIGEPPTSKGYTPSVFAFLPKLLERAGNFQSGSITGLYTVLVEGDDMNDPVADTARSTLDGHIVLSRKLAQSGHYPAIDVLQSVSRVMIDIVSNEHLECANRLKEILATFQESEDLINIGAYAEGSNPKIDYALAMIDNVLRFQKQDIAEKAGFDDSLLKLNEIYSLKTESNHE